VQSTSLPDEKYPWHFGLVIFFHVPKINNLKVKEINLGVVYSYSFLV